MIEVKNVTKEFKQANNKTILADDNISFNVEDGTIVGILGPNGAGKTTLLRMMAGILKPTSGTITYDNLDFFKSELEIKKQIAYLSGNTKLYNTITGRELLSMFASIYGVEEKNYKKRIEEIIKRLDLESFIDKRINIARCLVHNPKYYILDEATSGLDIISSQVILDFIKEEKKKGSSIIYSTHYMEEAENICDYVILINNGRIIATGTPEEINKKTKQSNLRDAFFKLIGGVKND